MCEEPRKSATGLVRRVTSAADFIESKSYRHAISHLKNGKKKKKAGIDKFKVQSNPCLKPFNSLVKIVFAEYTEQCTENVIIGVECYPPKNRRLYGAHELGTAPPSGQKS